MERITTSQRGKVLIAPLSVRSQTFSWSHSMPFCGKTLKLCLPSSSVLSLTHAGHNPKSSRSRFPIQVASTEGESFLLSLCISLDINRKQAALDSLNKRPNQIGKAEDTSFFHTHPFPSHSHTNYCCIQVGGELEGGGGIVQRNVCQIG